jgi:hypothetical protein
MRIRLIAVLTIAALAAGALLAASGLSGDGSVEPATSFQTRYTEARGASELEPADSAEPRLARKGSGIVVRHLVTKKWITVDSNHILRIVCPRGFEPLTGGALSGPELAISNSSRVHPEKNVAEKRSWYIGVTNLTLQGQRFKGTIVCAKGL